MPRHKMRARDVNIKSAEWKGKAPKTDGFYWPNYVLYNGEKCFRSTTESHFAKFSRKGEGNMNNYFVVTKKELLAHYKNYE